MRLRPLALVSSATLLAAVTGCSGQPTTGTGTFATLGGAAAPAVNGAAQVSVTMSGDRCISDHSSALAGPVTFTVRNTDATSISEIELLSDQRILGEKENVVPGLAPVKFTVTLSGGTYQLYCPGASSELQGFNVAGTAADRPASTTKQLFTEGAAGYGSYVTNAVADLVTATHTLTVAVDSGDVAAAKSAYANARRFYEKIESDVAGFVIPGASATDNSKNFDYLIDMRATNLDPVVGWHGFHAIERDLWEHSAITASTKSLAHELDTNVTQLAALSKSLVYRPEDLGNGAAALLEEVQSKKIKGTEEAYSHLDLLDFAANIEGAQQAYAFLKPGLDKLDPDLSRRISGQFQAVLAALMKYKDPAALGGYHPWTSTLRSSDAARLSKTVQGLQDPLSRIAEKVATAS